jgi:basic amino acid/polyamine antiporter, APA family
VTAGDWDAVAFVPRLGAAVGVAGVLLSLLAGTSRTVLSMARRRELPGFLDAVHPVFKTPYRAELTIAGVVCGVVLVSDLRGAIGFSSFAVLIYYLIANASAWTLTADRRRWPRWLAGVGIGLCVALAVTLPLASVVTATLLLAVGSAGWLATRRYHRDEGTGGRLG